MFSCGLHAQLRMDTLPGNLNPFIPGYFADPTIKKFGDSYYLYSTTDGNGGGHGPSQVWISKDFENWVMKDMNWPTTNYYWAPDCLYNNGKYYLYYCQPCEIYGAESDSPTGPWTPLLSDGKPMIPNYFVPGVITLDGQTFKDDNGQVYMVWGTWGIYPGHGCGIGRLNPDMKSFDTTFLIPNTVLKDFFEGPFMFKRNGLYYLMYSSGYCENSTYRVQYAISRNGPLGPYHYGPNNPILSTNVDSSVDGPGHNSVIQIGNEWYIVYHRHNNPPSNGGFFRQICYDKINFDSAGNIKKIIPSNGRTRSFNLALPISDSDLAYRKSVLASSSYGDDFRPSFAVDHNNGTLWKPADNATDPQWITIDLGKVFPIKEILTQFEYPCWYYQYLLTCSVDNHHWYTFSDRRHNIVHGSPMVDTGSVRARYVKLIIYNTQYPGLFKSLWNIKIYSSLNDKLPFPVYKVDCSEKNIVSVSDRNEPLIHFDCSSLPERTMVSFLKNTGSLGGQFTANSDGIFCDVVSGRKALWFDGLHNFVSDFKLPRIFSGNSSYSIAFWAFIPELLGYNPVISWAQNGTDHANAVFGYGSDLTQGVCFHQGFSDMGFKKVPEPGAWHFIVITFDGYFEKVYVDGSLDNSKNKMLFISSGDYFKLGSDLHQGSFFRGAIHSLDVFGKVLDAQHILALYQHSPLPDVAVYLDASQLNYGSLDHWSGKGFKDTTLYFKNRPLPFVLDEKGKIAVKLDNGQWLQLLNHLSAIVGDTEKSFSLILNVSVRKELENRGVPSWIPVVFVSHKNGIEAQWLDHTKWLKNRGDLTSCLKSITGNQVFISFLELILRPLNRQQISFVEKKFCLENKIKVTQPFFKKPPIRISPSLVSMEASSDWQNVSYQFDNLSSHIGSGWIRSSHYLESFDQNFIHPIYTLKVKDFYGNVSQPAVWSVKDFPVLHTDTSDFSGNWNFIHSVSLSSWSGWMGPNAQDSSFRMETQDGKLLLQSANSSWSESGSYGPFIFKEVTGDFMAEACIDDLSGLEQKIVTGNNDVGLMVRFHKSPDSSENLIQNSVFPAWNCGNMLTVIKSGNRVQKFTGTGWRFYHFIQIERSGSFFYLRISKDGFHWQEMPGSPILMEVHPGMSIQVGLYQASYGPKVQYGKFLYFKIYRH